MHIIVQRAVQASKARRQHQAKGAEAQAKKDEKEVVEKLKESIKEVLHEDINPADIDIFASAENSSQTAAYEVDIMHLTVSKEGDVIGALKARCLCDKCREIDVESPEIKSLADFGDFIGGTHMCALCRAIA